MIYKDECAINDTPNQPAVRLNEKCLNCSKTWSYHTGWLCDKYYVTDNQYGFTFDKVKILHRYVTQSMVDSYIDRSLLGYDLTKQYDPEPVIEETPDWKKFQNLGADKCPCGLLKGQCTYHP